MNIVKNGRLEDKDSRTETHPTSSEKDWPSETLRFISHVLIVAGILVSLFIIFLIFWYAFHVILVGFVGVILAVFLRGLADWFGKLTRLSTGWSLAAVILLLVGGVSVSFLFIIPHVSGQIGDLQEKMLSSLAQIKQSISQIPLGQDLIRQFPNFQGNSSSTSGAVAKSAQKIFSMTFTTLTELIVVIFLGLYLSVDPDRYVNGFVRLFPIRFRKRTHEVIGEIGNTLRWWLVGIFFDMALVGILTWIGLRILKVPLAMILAIISGLLTFIPTFGLLISMIPAILMAITEGFGKVIAVIILYLVAHAIEAYIAAPLVQQKAVSLPPAILILSLLGFGALFGVLGLIVAAPLTAVALVLIKIVYVEHVLGDRVKKPA